MVVVNTSPWSAPLQRRTVLGAALAGLLGSTLWAGCSPDSIPGDMVRADLNRRPPDTVPAEDVVASLTRFSAEVSVQAQAGNQVNFLCSPLSLWLALAMTRNGAAGKTAAEMDAALRFGDLAQLNQALNTTSQVLVRRAGKQSDGHRRGEISLSIANQLFGDKTFSAAKNAWRAPFLAALAQYYGTGMALADFRGDPSGERRRINAWVADQTHDKINKLLSDGMISNQTKLVLVNALYLAAPWIDKFSPVGKRRFHTAGKTVQADMMRIDLHSVAARTAFGTAVRIPYLGKELAMTLMLPTPGHEATFRDRFVRELPRILGPLAPAQIILTMPKFTYRTAIDVKPILQARGMQLAFTDDADFSLMSPQSLEITDIAHQCTIGVDEEGTEASAATAVVIGPTSAGPPQNTIELTLDRPFWYVIHDVPTRVPLFVGYVADPTA